MRVLESCAGKSFTAILLGALVASGVSWTRPARAEYRVFQLAITDTQTSQTRTVLSTLDDLQYAGYYPLRTVETIAIQDTWMCWQRGDGFKSYCPNPKAQSKK